MAPGFFHGDQSEGKREGERREKREEKIKRRKREKGKQMEGGRRMRKGSWVGRSQEPKGKSKKESLSFKI